MFGNTFCIPKLEAGPIKIANPHASPESVGLFHIEKRPSEACNRAAREALPSWGEGLPASQIFPDSPLKGVQERAKDNQSSWSPHGRLVALAVVGIHLLNR